jgi:hypothetical protein
MSGALLHANYAEALLDSRAFPAISEKVAIVFELLFGLGAALLFAITASVARQIVWLVLLSAFFIF